LPDPVAVLRDVDLYVGDGATLDLPLIRRRGTVRIGHATIATQLGWCAAAGVKQAVFTHCGSRIVRADSREAAAALKAMADKYGVGARFAHDGLRLNVMTPPRPHTGRRR
jgi:hypothetical protein